MTKAKQARADELGMSLSTLQELYGYLDDLREDGITNMYGAGMFLELHYDLPRRLAGKVLSAWMKEFGGRTHKIGRG